MSHIAHHLVKAILDALGMSQREQFLTIVGTALLAFALYAGKQFATQKVYATLYLLTGLAFCVFMTTDKVQTRMLAGGGLCFALCAMFAWYFATKTIGQGSASPARSERPD